MIEELRRLILQAAHKLEDPELALVLWDRDVDPSVLEGAVRFHGAAWEEPSHGSGSGSVVANWRNLAGDPDGRGNWIQIHLREVPEVGWAWRINSHSGSYAILARARAAGLVVP